MTQADTVPGPIVAAPRRKYNVDSMALSQITGQHVQQTPEDGKRREAIGGEASGDRSHLIRRVAAFLADVALLFLVLGPLSFLLQRLTGVSPEASREIYATLLVSFSLPAWTYFALADRSRSGATVGKRLLGLRTERADGARLGGGRALGRTAVKMVPWEASHASAFLFAPAAGAFGLGNWLGLGAAYALCAVYLLAAWRSGGRRSVHDRIAATRVVRVDARTRPADGAGEPGTAP